MINKNERGSALVLVIIVLAVFVILLSSFLFITSSQGKQIIRSEKKLQAHYLARAGADSMLSWISKNFYTNPSGVSNLLDITSPWVSLGKGKFQVKITGNSELLFIQSWGQVDNVVETMEVELELGRAGELPEEDEIADIFPPDFDFNNGWWDGTDTAGGTGWVKKNNGHVIGEKIYRDEDDQYISVRFPATITVEHQEGQQTFELFSTYLYFMNPKQSLYVKQGNTLVLNGDIIVFRGLVELAQSGNNYGELQLKANNYEIINGQRYGKVYFYEDVKYGQNKNHLHTLIPAGAYFFKDGLTITGEPGIYPSIYNGGLIPILDIRNGVIKWH